MVLANTSIFWVIVMPLRLNKFGVGSSKYVMLASMPSVRPTSHIICSTSSCSTNKACFSGASSQHIFGTIPHSSVRTSSDCWYAGLRSVAIHPLSFFGDCKTRVFYPRTLPKNVAVSSAVSTQPAATSVLLRPATVARAQTGMLSRTGVVLMVAVQKTMITN